MLTSSQQYSPAVVHNGAIILRDLDSLVGDHLSPKEKELLHMYLLQRLGELESAVRFPRQRWANG